MTGTTTGANVILNGALTLFNGNLDDGWFRVYLPFDVIWGGVTYDEVWISTNSRVMFLNYIQPTIGDNYYGIYNANNTGQFNSELFISAADNCCQRLLGKYTAGVNESYTIRYEGCSWNGTTTPAGQSDIIWELTFNSATEYDNTFKLDVILNGRITSGETSYSALVDRQTSITTFVPKTASSWIVTFNGNYSGGIAAIVFKRNKRLVISGTLGTMLIGDEEINVGTSPNFTGGAIIDPETYRTQIYFHSNLPYIKIDRFIAIPTITFAAVAADYRTWPEPGSGGCGSGCF